MDREDFQNALNEQEQWATRALSGVPESALFSAPATSDAEFLMRVRDRIEKKDTVAYRPQRLSSPRLVWVASACVILLVAVIAGGRFSRNYVGTSRDLARPTAVPVDTVQNNMAAMTTDNVVDSLADADVDATELAVYLGVPDYAEEEEEEGDVADTVDDSPLTDQLLALDTRTLEEVLKNLEGTEFF